MKILTFDITLSAGSIGLWEDGRLRVHLPITQDRGQAQFLVPLLQQAIRQAQWDFKDVDLIAVTTGPGSFTGVRIGLATAQGLGLALGKPVMGISTFDALVHSLLPQLDKTLLIVALDTRRGDAFVQAYTSHLEPVGQPFVSSDEKALARLQEQAQLYKSVIVAGDGVAYIPVLHPTQHILPEHKIPHADALAHLAAARFPHKEDYPPLPLYLREADVTMPTISSGPCESSSLSSRPRPSAEWRDLPHKEILRLRILLGCSAQDDKEKRKAKESDSATVARLMQACLGPDAWSAASIAQALDQAGTVLVLAEDSSPCGYVLFRHLADEGEILSIGVHPTRQHQGIGRRLLRHALDALHQQGVVKVFLEVAVDNAPAIRFYEKEGFVYVHTRPQYYPRPKADPVDAWVMLRTRGDTP